MSSLTSLGNTIDCDYATATRADENNRVRFLTLPAPMVQQARVPWILTLHADIVDGSIPEGASGASTNLLRAFIVFGSEGANHTAVVDVADNAVLQLPATAVSVDLFWDRRVSSDLESYSVWYPALTRVSGTLVQGFTTTRAQRSFIANVTDSVPSFSLIKRVPPFARGVMVHSEETAVTGAYAAASFLALGEQQDSGPPTTPGFRITTYPGPELKAAKDAGEWLMVPPAANVVALKTDPDNQARTTVVFQLEL